ncbi:MAG TPA: response regulator [Myxococcaceae bacterium]|nr:response regulator [Myxococcaceae bacterium]
MNRHVLVIEDNPVNQKLVVKYLSAKGYRVVGAATTEEADAAFGSDKPGLVLVDVSLPGEDGLSWVRRTRESGETGVPMVALTAHALPADRERALAAGCEEFITKPVELKMLLRLTEKYLGVPQAA